MARKAKPQWQKDYAQRMKEQDKLLARKHNPEHLTQWEYHNGSTYIHYERLGPYSKRIAVTKWAADKKDMTGRTVRYKQQEKKAGVGGGWFPVEPPPKP